MQRTGRQTRGHPRLGKTERVGDNFDEHEKTSQTKVGKERLSDAEAGRDKTADI